MVRHNIDRTDDIDVFGAQQVPSDILLNLQVGFNSHCTMTSNKIWMVMLIGLVHSTLIWNLARVRSLVKMMENFYLIQMVCAYFYTLMQ